jgi:hypothetical protein
MSFKTFGISGFCIFAYKFFLAPTTSLKRTVIFRLFFVILAVLGTDAEEATSDVERELGARSR